MRRLMDESFLETLKSRALLGDGAMGTEIYRRGIFINRCYDELNLSQPDLIATIHQDYADAGADILTTNTYGATRLRLKRHGLEAQVTNINASRPKSSWRKGSTSSFWRPSTS